MRSRDYYLRRPAVLFTLSSGIASLRDKSEEWKKFHRQFNKCCPPDRPCESLCQEDLFIKFMVDPSITLPYFASAGANTQIQARHPKSWEGRKEMLSCHRQGSVVAEGPS